MNPMNKQSALLLLGLAMAIAPTPAARANVYATNIKLNGGHSNVTVAQGSSISISYILNEPASSGATINILSGATIVRSISIAAGNPGTLTGLNTVLWDVKDNSSNTVPVGVYALTITAASLGYTNWMQTTSDANPGNYVYWPAGIAVNCNTNSPYYGRVMVCNSGPNSSGTTLGDTNGIVKLNADGSYADEGQGNAGYFINASDGFLGDVPRRARIAADDRLYVNDWSGNGKILAVDMLMTSNQVILDSAVFTGFAASGNWSEIDITDVGTTNALAWFADFNYPPQGVYAWPITNNGAADPANTTGTLVVGWGGNDIPVRSGPGLMIDENKDIFIGDVRSNPGDPAPRASCITNWPSSTEQPIYNANLSWAVGGGDDTFRDISDLAIDSRTSPHYVACTLSGASGGMRILNAADGSVVTNLQQDGTVFFVACGWDNVGNVYGGIGTHLWRAFSPPGANQATTPALESIQVATPPTITSIALSSGTVTINFTGSAFDAPTAFTLLSSATVGPAGSYAPAAGVTITLLAPGSFQATVPAVGAVEFYRFKR